MGSSWPRNKSAALVSTSLFHDFETTALNIDARDLYFSQYRMIMTCFKPHLHHAHYLEGGISLEHCVCKHATSMVKPRSH